MYKVVLIRQFGQTDEIEKNLKEEKSEGDSRDISPQLNCTLSDY